jgi:hypothetical protein
MLPPKPVQPRRILTPRIAPPGRNGLVLLVAGLLGLALWSWQLFEAGRGWAGYDFERSRAQEAALHGRIEELEASVKQLRLEAASNARASQIDREAVRQAQDSLARLVEERARLTQEVSLLRGLLSSGRGPLHVQNFSLRPQADGSVGYRFTVVQALRNIGATRGAVYLKVSGKQDGKATRLGLKELAVGGESRLPVDFTHYQDLEGVIRLPKDFQPESVTIDIRPKNRKLKRVTEVFQWQLAES